MALKVKLIIVPTIPDTGPGSGPREEKPVCAEREICEFFRSLFKAGVTREFRDWLQPGNYLCTRNLLLDGWAHEPVHRNLSLLRERNIER